MPVDGFFFQVLYPDAQIVGAFGSEVVEMDARRWDAGHGDSFSFPGLLHWSLEMLCFIDSFVVNRRFCSFRLSPVRRAVSDPLSPPCGRPAPRRGARVGFVKTMRIFLCASLSRLVPPLYNRLIANTASFQEAVLY